jgi:alcohol dehydrogenase class IV
MIERAKIPSLASFGVRAEHFADIAAKAKRASSMKGNPIDLTDDELIQVLNVSL